MKKTFVSIWIILVVSTATQAKVISSVMPTGGAGFDPWNKTRWADWYDSNGVLVEPFEMDVSVVFAAKTTSWWFDSTSVRRIYGGLPSVFLLLENSDIDVNGNGIVIDARPLLDLGYDLYYYYSHTINLDSYSDENCFLVGQSEYVTDGDAGSRIHNMTIKGFSRGVAFHHEHGRKTTIENIDFIRDIWGVFPRGQNGIVKNCYFKENVMGGFYCEYNSYDWVIQNNIFKDNNTRGVKSYGDIVVDACRDYLIADNTFQTASYFTRPYHTAISIYRNRGENLDIRELAPRDNIITHNTFNDFNIGIDFAPRQANFSNNDNSEEARCYTMDNSVIDNTFNDCKIGVLLRSNYTTIADNTFNNNEIDIALLNMFYAIHHNTIDQPGDHLWLWSTPDEYVTYSSYISYVNQAGDEILKSEKFFHIICPGDYPEVHNDNNVEFLIADSLVVPDKCDINSDLTVNIFDLIEIANDWLTNGTFLPFTKQSTDLTCDNHVNLKDYSVCLSNWQKKNGCFDFYSVSSKQPIDIAVGDMAVFEQGDEIAVIWDQPVSNISGTNYYTIGIFDQRGNELDRCGRSSRRWSSIAVGNFLPDGGWIQENDNFEIAAVSSEPDENGKYPVYIFHKGFMTPTVVLQADNTNPIVALTAGNFTTETDDYDELAIKAASMDEIICLKPSDINYSATITNVATNITDIASGEFSGRASQDEIAAITDSVGPVLIYKIGTDGIYKTCADYNKNWQTIAVGRFDDQLIRENIVVTESPEIDNSHTIGYWSFEENTGQYAYGDLFVSNPLTLRLGSSTSTWQDPEWSSDGYRGTNCLHFIAADGRPDGGLDILRPESDADVTAFNSGSFTVQAWIKLDSIPQDTFDWYNPYTIISFGGKDSQNNNKHSYFLRVTRRANGNGMLNGYYYDTDDSGVSVLHPAELVPNKWYHVAFAHDASKTTNNTSIWVNGVASVISSDLHPRTDLTITGESFCVGAMWNRMRGFNGLIDELKVSDSKLTTEDILTNIESDYETIYFFTDSDNIPFRELQLPFLAEPPLAIDAGKLYASEETSMYQTTEGITKQQLYSDYTIWKDSIAVLPSRPKKHSTPVFWIGINPLDPTQSCYRLVPILR